MAAEGTSFLPRILSVFYAVFHDNRGTSIVYQVPEGLIATSNASLNVTLSTAPTLSSSSVPSEVTEAASQANSAGKEGAEASRTSSSSRSYSHLANSRDTFGSSLIRASSTTRHLFKFEDISRYVIPSSPLCGRLITCTTRKHKVIGFPVELYNEKRYERNFYRYNVCFVFDRTADLSCYEPIVRKIGRVLTACEEESSFLSSPDTSTSIYAILEQLYEDLNSYSETSIPIDKFNSIELKIFPFYPNPPEVHDWEVPVALIGLKKRIEDNWDLTMAKVCLFIDGVNHVTRIAELAECDLDLTREAIRHLMFYQVIMMIDIFQFSNMYTLCRSISWLADESHVRGECGPYVTQEDREISEWPDLLHLYSRLKPGITVFEWMEEYDTEKHGIDPRRFVSFGVIKGFLRRVHRWPVLLEAPPPERVVQQQQGVRERRASSASLSFGRRRGKSLSLPGQPGASTPPTPQLPGAASPGTTTPPVLADSPALATGGFFSRNTAAGVGLGGALTRTGSRANEEDRDVQRKGQRRASAAEKYLGQFREQAAAQGTNVGQPQTASDAIASVRAAVRTSPQRERIRRYSRGSADVSGTMPRSRRQSLIQPTTNTGNMLGGPIAEVDDNSTGLANGQRPRLERMPTAPGHVHHPTITSTGSRDSGRVGSPAPLAPMSDMMIQLQGLLDGTRHTDELGVQFELGWPALEKHLVVIGGGKGDGDFGRVEIICR